ncbi:Golgi-associated RAB2 interactor protein 5A isoform 3-T3 [Pangshura tecta]
MGQLRRCLARGEYGQLQQCPLFESDFLQAAAPALRAALHPRRAAAPAQGASGLGPDLLPAAPGAARPAGASLRAVGAIALPPAVPAARRLGQVIFKPPGEEKGAQGRCPPSETRHTGLVVGGASHPSLESEP